MPTKAARSERACVRWFGLAREGAPNAQAPTAPTVRGRRAAARSKREFFHATSYLAPQQRGRFVLIELRTSSPARLRTQDQIQDWI